jgi:hypothetical protein
MLIVVEMKFTAPEFDDTPARCREKIARYTDAPAWAIPPARGRYTVYPLSAVFSTMLLASNKVSDGGSNQNAMLCVGMLCLVLPVLVVLVSFQTHHLGLVVL